MSVHQTSGHSDRVPDEHSILDLDLPLTQRSFVKEQLVLDHLSERAQQNPLFKQQLLDCIERSKSDKQWRIAASNAITILIRSGVQFNHADLRGVRIPYADISHGVFESAQLQGADLRHVNLQGAWLRNADMSKAKMMGVQFGERPYLLGGVKQCTISPDGTSLLIIRNFTIDVYSTFTWKKQWTLEGHTTLIGGTACSPDGRQFASGDRQNIVRLWDIKSGVCSHILRCHEPHRFIQTTMILCVAYSASGDQVATAGTSCSIQLWDTNSGECLRILIGHTSFVNCMTYSPLGNQIASGSGNGAIRLWNIETQEPSYLLSGHTGRVDMVQFSSQSDRLASSSRDRTVRVWNTTTREYIYGFTGVNHTGAIRYSPRNDQVAIAGEFDTLYLWDTLSGTYLALQGHGGGGIEDIEFSPEGDLLASCSSNETVRVWDTAMGSCRQILTGHSSAVQSICFLPKGDLIVSGDRNNSVRFWDVAGAPSNHVHHVQGLGSPISMIKFSPKGDQVATTSYANTIWLWDSETGRPLHTLQGHTSTVHIIAYSPQGNLIASTSSDSTVRIWSVDTGDCVHTISPLTNSHSDITFSPGGNQLATCSGDNAVRNWSVESGQCLQTLVGHTEHVTSVVYSPDGSKLTTCSGDSTIRTWDPETGDCCHIIRGNDVELFRKVLYSPQGDLMVANCGVVGGRQKTIVWDATTGTRLFDLPGGDGNMYSIASTPNGEMIVTSMMIGINKLILLWNARSGEQVHMLSGHGEYALHASFSRLGNMVASASEDQTVRIWDVVSGECLAVIDGFRGGVQFAVWSPTTTGDYLVAASKDRTLGKWKVTTDGGQCRVQLCWRNTRGALSLEGTNIQDAQGLSQLNRQLLEQRGAVGKPADMDVIEAK